MTSDQEKMFHLFQSAFRYVGSIVDKDAFSLYSFLKFDFHSFAGFQVDTPFSIHTFSEYMFSTFDAETMLSFHLDAPNRLQGGWHDADCNFYIVLAPSDTAFQKIPLQGDVQTYLLDHIISVSQQYTFAELLKKTFHHRHDDRTLQFVEHDQGYAIKVTEGKDMMYQSIQYHNIFYASNGILVSLDSASRLITYPL